VVISHSVCVGWWVRALYIEQNPVLYSGEFSMIMDEMMSKFISVCVRNGALVHPKLMRSFYNFNDMHTLTRSAINYEGMYQGIIRFKYQRFKKN